MSAMPTWFEEYCRLCSKLGGGLTLMGLDKTCIAVYIYLFYLAAKGGEKAASAPCIVNRVGPMSAYMPGPYRTSYTEKTVRTALRKLVELGLAESVEADKEPGAAGRPPLAYKAVAVSAAIARVAEVIEGYKKSVMDALAPLEQFEEGLAMGRRNPGGASK